VPSDRQDPSDPPEDLDTSLWDSDGRALWDSEDRAPGDSEDRALRDSDDGDVSEADLQSWPLHERPGGMMMTDLEHEVDLSNDFAAVAYREENQWDVDLLPVALTRDFDGLLHALRQQPSISGAIGMVAVADDFFILVRSYGRDNVSLFLSDVTASIDWQVARDVLERLDIELPDEEDLDQVLPAGDLSILADLGVDEMELGALAGDLDLYPDEVLASISERLGFQQSFQRALDSLG
jgi:putative tRNA adenosine deaminase-associated protein